MIWPWLVCYWMKIPFEKPDSNLIIYKQAINRFHSIVFTDPPFYKKKYNDINFKFYIKPFCNTFQIPKNTDLNSLFIITDSYNTISLHHCMDWKVSYCVLF